MINELGEKRFNNQFRADATPDMNDYVFIYGRDAEGKEAVLVRVNEDGVEVPKIKDVLSGCGDYQLEDESGLIYLFSIGGNSSVSENSSDEDVDEYGENSTDEDVDEYCETTDYYLADEEFARKCDWDKLDMAGWSLESLRVFRKDNPRDVCMAGATANHLHGWYAANRCCGKCGAKMVHDAKLRMVKCPECGNMVFPRLNPAVTIGLRNRDSLMVSRYANRPGSTGMALLAGFVEIGETLEECVAREVMEEVGMKAVNIQYFGSQPWGFAGNIQIGFFADVEGSTEVVLDEEELASARFIARDEIPENPDGLSLTQAMIEAFRKGEW